MYNEQDFIIRQIRGIAKTISKFFGLEEVKEFLNIDQSQESLTDDELETILAAVRLESIMTKTDWEPATIANEINISVEHLNLMLADEVTATPDELERLKQFIDKHIDYV